MTTITIDTGESVSLGFEINGVDVADIIDFSVYFGNVKYSKLNATIEQDISNEKLFFVRISSKITNDIAGSNKISFALITEFLGVYKEDKIAILEVKETNEKTSLPMTSEFITATFVIDVVTNVVTTNVILQQIYASGGTGAVFPKIQFTADGAQNTFDLGTSVKAKAVFLNGAILDDGDFSQPANALILTFTPALGEIIKPI